MLYKTRLACDKNFNEHSQSGRLGRVGLNSVAV